MAPQFCRVRLPTPILRGLASFGRGLYTGPDTQLKKPLTKAELSQLNDASGNAEAALLIITCGITSIGNILACIGSSDDEVGSKTLADIVYLVETLGEMAQNLNWELDNLNHTKRLHVALTGKPG